jgi:hypothetical protein
MIFWLLIFALGSGFAAWRFTVTDKSWYGRIWILIILCITGFFVSSHHAYTDIERPLIDDWQFEIIAAADGTSVEGEFGGFFIFSGSIDEVPYYSYYRQHGDGSITQGQVRVSDARIYQDAEPGEGWITHRAYGNVWTPQDGWSVGGEPDTWMSDTYGITEWNRWWSPAWHMQNIHDPAPSYSYRTWAIHVPEGSVTQQFVFDLN